MKKMISMMLAMVIITVVMAGCGQKTEKETTESQTSNQNETAATADNEQAAETKTEETDWPKKPIQLVVPVDAGGDTDTNARIMAKYLEGELGQPVVVTNMGGASGSIGTRKVADSKPDGYTALFFHNTTLLAEMRGLLDVDVINDFKIAGIPIKDQTGILVANASKYKDLEDFMDQAKASPGEIKVAAATGSLAQLIPLAMEQETGVDFNIVDAGGTSERIASLMGGHIDMFYGQYGVLKDYIDNGDFVCLGSVSGSRSSLMSDIPTLKEQGIDVDFDKFFYFAFPPETPDAVADKFSKALETVTAMDEVKKDLSVFMLEPSYTGPADSVTYMQGVYDFYGKYKDVFVTQ